MAKQRFRDTKQGRITKNAAKKEKKEKNKIKYAGRMDYFKAVLIDSFMLLMPIMYFVFYVVFSGREDYGKHWQQGGLYILIALIAIESIFLIFKGQTPGMKAYNLKLISLYTLKKPMPQLIVARQVLAKIVLLAWGWLIIFFDYKGRNLHDIILHTALVYDDKE